MIALTGPTVADCGVADGLTLFTLRPGSDQTAHSTVWYDTSGQSRLTVNRYGALTTRGQQIIASTSGSVITLLIDGGNGFLQLGSTAGLGAHLYSGSGAPTISAVAGDYYLRTDTPTVAGQRLYICTADGANWTGFPHDANGNLSADNHISNRTSTATAAGTTTLDINSTQVQVFTGSTTQTVLLPTTGVIAGQTYTVINQSTGTVTVDSSGSNAIQGLTAGRIGTFIAKVDTPTAAADWHVVDLTASISASVHTMAQRDGSANLTANTLISSRASTATAGTTTTLSIASSQVQVFTGTQTQIVLLPTTSVVAGQLYTIINNSSGSVTVQSSGGNTVTTLTTGQAALCVALQDTPTTAAHWRAI